MKKLILTFILSFPFIIDAQLDTTIHLLLQDELINQVEEIIINNDIQDVDNLEDELSDEFSNLLVGSQFNLNALAPEVACNLLNFTDYQYYQLLLYIEQYGQLVSVYELMAIDGFADFDLQRILPFVEVKPLKESKTFFKNFFKRSKHDFLFRYSQLLEKMSGYDTLRASHYLGSPQRLCFKYQFSTQDKLFLAFSGEKDAGEQFFRQTQKQGFDFYSGHIALKNVGVLKSLIIGDYKLSVGQGLVVGTNLLSGKGGGVESVLRFSSPPRPVAPLNEGNFLRGVAATIGNYSYSGTLFYSYRKMDGELTDVESDSLSFDGSLFVMGNHRTENEILKKNKVSCHFYGFDFLYRHRLFKMGVRATRTNLSLLIEKRTQLYRIFDFAGKAICNLGIDYQWVLKSVLLFGELGVSGNGALAFLQGTIIEVAPTVKFSALFRYYQKDYIALYGGAFGANSKNKNEMGLYLSAHFILNGKLEMEGYFDFYRCPWLAYRIDIQSLAMDGAVSFFYTVNKKSMITFRYQYKRRMKNCASDYYNVINEQDIHKFKSTLSYKPIPSLNLMTEVDFLINHWQNPKKNSVGFLIFQNVGYSFQKIGLSLQFRFALFDTDTYDDRIYAYENDLYNCFTINSYYDQGCRFYLMIKYSYSFLDIWLRCSQTYYTNKNEIGSGLTHIASSHKTELKLQVCFNW